MSDTPYRIGVISDTHGLLRPDVFEIFQGVDLILHAGDIEGDELLTELETIAPVQAVSGNVDFPTREGLRPMTRRIETPAARIAMTHGHLDRAPSTRPDLMADFFADFAPDIIIYGHSHVPKLEQVGSVRVFNPGAAGHARFGHGPSVGLITENPGGAAIIEHRYLKWERRGGRA